MTDFLRGQVLLSALTFCTVYVKTHIYNFHKQFRRHLLKTNGVQTTPALTRLAPRHVSDDEVTATDIFTGKYIIAKAYVPNIHISESAVQLERNNPAGQRQQPVEKVYHLHESRSLHFTPVFLDRPQNKTQQPSDTLRPPSTKAQANEADQCKHFLPASVPVFQFLFVTFSFP